MKIILALITILIGFSVNAKPGYVSHSYNLNDLPEEYVSLNQKYPEIYRLSILIDTTTTEFSKLNWLKKHKELSFDIRVEPLPKEFNTVVFDSISKLVLFCNGITTDLSNIKGFKQAKEVSVHNFSGNKIPKNIEDFIYLESLHIQESKNLKNIDALKNLKSLKFVTIDCNSLKEFPVFNKSTPISHIVLNGVHNNLNFKNLNSLQKLGGIEITIPNELKEFPNYLSKNLKKIRISGSINSISNLTFYPNLEYIQIRNTYLERFDIDFKGNTSIKNIGIDHNPKLHNIDAVYSCEGLEYLLLNALPELEEFDLKNLNLKKGLSIQATGVKTVIPIEKLEKLPYLYIKYNNYLNIDIESISPKWDISDNGKFR